MFKDRNDAALQLVQRLAKYRNKNGIVLAVPRGGVPIGYVVARELGLPLEIILSKKIGHPFNPEFAIGSVTLHSAVINENMSDVSDEYIRSESNRILQLLKEKYKLYMGDRKPTGLKDKTVIIVDDGIATGNTILATIDAIKQSKPKEIIIAIPVAPPSTINRLEKFVDEVICLDTPENFFGVGQFYHDFSQVSDEEVIKLLEDAHRFKNVA